MDASPRPKRAANDASMDRETHRGPANAPRVNARASSHPAPRQSANAANHMVTSDLSGGTKRRHSPDRHSRYSPEPRRKARNPEVSRSFLRPTPALSLHPRKQAGEARL